MEQEPPKVPPLPLAETPATGSDPEVRAEKGPGTIPKPHMEEEEPPLFPGFTLEAFMGVKLFAWLGGLALFLGVVFFIRYSFEHDLITPQMRVTIGALTGYLYEMMLASIGIRHEAANTAGRAERGDG